MLFRSLIPTILKELQQKITTKLDKYKTVLTEAQVIDDILTGEIEDLANSYGLTKKMQQIALKSLQQHNLDQQRHQQVSYPYQPLVSEHSKNPSNDDLLQEFIVNFNDYRRYRRHSNDKESLTYPEYTRRYSELSTMLTQAEDDIRTKARSFIDIQIQLADDFLPLLKEGLKNPYIAQDIHCVISKLLQPLLDILAITSGDLNKAKGLNDKATPAIKLRAIETKKIKLIAERGYKGSMPQRQVTPPTSIGQNPNSAFAAPSPSAQKPPSKVVVENDSGKQTSAYDRAQAIVAEAGDFTI